MCYIKHTAHTGGVFYCIGLESIVCHNERMSSEGKIEAYFFTAFFVSILVAVGYMFLPFLGAIATAIVLATLSYPLYERVFRICRIQTLAATITTLVVTLSILLPAMGLFVLMLEEARGISQLVSSFDVSTFPNTIDSVIVHVTGAIPLLGSLDLGAIIQKAFESLTSGIAGFVVGTADAVFNVFLTIFALFFFLRDGRVFLAGFIKLSPLSDDEDVLIVRKLRVVSASLIRGTLTIAVLQGLLTGIGLLLFGVPNPVLWGSFAAFGALVPTIGIGLVTVPILAYLALTGQFVAFVGFATWSILIAGTVDNVLGPKLIGGRAHIHPLFILFSVLGGLLLFGPPGFLIGPLLFGLLVALSEIYVLKIKAMRDDDTRKEKKTNHS